MATWSQFADRSPALAAFGEARLASRVAYLATTKADGSPRVHPFTPFVTAGRLVCFMHRASPKAADLGRDPRYAIHCSVDDEQGGAGEFWISGRAQRRDDPSLLRSARSAAGYEVAEEYVLFEFDVLHADSLVYGDEGQARRRWRDT